MVVVDTTVWIDYLNERKTPQTRWLDAEVGRQRLALTDLILCEVLQGLPDDAAARRVQSVLARFEVLTMGGADLASTAARNYRHLRARGLTVRKTADCLIASFCILNGHALLHSDHDYEPFEKHLGLMVVHPEGDRVH